MTKNKKTKKKSSKKTNDKRSFFRSLFKFVFVLGLWCVLVVGLILAWYARDLPELMRNAQFERRPAITIMGNDNKIIARYGDHKGENLSVKDLPEDLVHAVLATEDRRFYYHFGVDPLGILRAAYVNYKYDGALQGGSTITQQLAKNLFLTADKTIGRKIQEAMLAIWLEMKLSKDEILSAYLNRVYLGGGAFGIDAASYVYFDKPASELTLEESATIAGLLKAPSRYSPLANPEASEKRTRVVLNAMVEEGYIEESDIKKDVALSTPTPMKKPHPANSQRYYTDWIIEQLDDLVGVPQSDLIIETTFDAEIQRDTAETISRTVMAEGEANDVSQGAAIVMRPDGSVLAIVGGKDYGSSQFNRVTQAYRSPGSSFKPIVYLTALRQGWRMSSIVVDEPRSYGDYRPKNYGNKYYGPVSLYEALTLSLNTVAVYIANQVGPKNIIETARLLGITAPLDPYLSTALGSNGIPMIQMASVYASLATNGLAVQPYGIKKITSKKDGTVLYEHPTDTPPQVLPGYAISQLKEMMHSVVINGTGRGANPGVWAAGKTGTSQEYRDAWFNGFTEDYIALVWYGNDNNTPTKRVTGGSLPARSWKAIIQAAMNDPTPSSYKEISGKVGGFQSLLTRLFSFGDEGAQEGGIDENGDRRSTRRIIYSTGEQNNSTVREQPQQRRAPGQYRPVWEEERDINIIIVQDDSRL